MASILDICNLALERAEVSDELGDMSEDTPAGLAARTSYWRNLRFLLEQADWPFASKRAALALLPEDESYSEWGFRYAEPSDCLVPRDLVPRKEPFAWEGGAILTNVQDAKLRYTALIEDPNVYPELFVQALAWAVSADFASGLAKNANLSKDNRAYFELAFSRAVAKIIGAQRKKPRPRSEFEF